MYMYMYMYIYICVCVSSLCHHVTAGCPRRPSHQSHQSRRKRIKRKLQRRQEQQEQQRVHRCASHRLIPIDRPWIHWNIFESFWIISDISDRDHWSPIIDLPCGSPIVLFESFTRSLFKDCRTQRTWAGDDCRGAKIDVFIFKLPITANHSQLLPRSEAPAREKGCGLFPTEWTCKRVSKYY